MTLLDAELAKLTTVELGRLAAVQKESQTHGAPYGPIAVAALTELHVRAFSEHRHRALTSS